VTERHDPFAFVTALVAFLDPAGATLRFVSAGHPPPELVGREQPVRTDNGPPLGVAADARWQPAEVALPDRCSVVLYTDGLVEGRAAPGARERLGIEPIRALLSGATPGALSSVDLEGLVQLASEANGAGLADDVALLAVNVTR
jgi:serine phosphatase RsbU (regulator of sigma subunit)